MTGPCHSISPVFYLLGLELDEGATIYVTSDLLVVLRAASVLLKAPFYLCGDGGGLLTIIFQPIHVLNVRVVERHLLGFSIELNVSLDQGQLTLFWHGPHLWGCPMPSSSASKKLKAVEQTKLETPLG